MIFRYKEFINENTSYGITKEEHNLLKKISNKLMYELNPKTNKINIFDDVEVDYREFDNLFPLERLGSVRGNFNCSNNNLTSLKHSPKEIYGTFDCSNNNLTSLEYCPKHVGGFFNCSANEFYVNGRSSSIEDYPLCIIKGGISMLYKFEEVYEIITKNEELFISLLDNKKTFHQMVMRLDPTLIPFYKNIPPPSKNSKLLI